MNKEIYSTEHLPTLAETPHKCTITIDGDCLRIVTFLRTCEKKRVIRLIAIETVHIASGEQNRRGFETVNLGDSSDHPLSEDYWHWQHELLTKGAA